MDNFIETPIKPVRVGRTKTTMANKATEVKSTNTKPKYAKTKGEHTKDIVIAILITAVVAFIGGMVFADKQQAEVANAVKSAQATVTPTAEASPAPASK